MRYAICSIAVLFAYAGAAPAQQSAKQDTLKAWTAYQKLQKNYTAVSQKALKEYRKVLDDGGDRAAALKKYRAATGKLREKANQALTTFNAAFVKTDWNVWDVKLHSKLLEAGLQAAARHATEKGNLELALQANKKFLIVAPKSPRVPYIQLNIGDLYAVQGNVKSARDTYAELMKHNSTSIQSYAKQRFTLFGNPAPNVDSKQWIGGDAQSLTQLKGKVVVVDFWATWCGPCRVVMPGLSKLYDEYKDKGLVVMGLTRFYKNGYLPANPGEMISGGESVKGMDEKGFLGHVKAFRTNTKLSYPFVIGNADNFKDYLVRGIPTVAVVGRDGKVALLAVGSGSEPLVRAVVERELKGNRD